MLNLILFFFAALFSLSIACALESTFTPIGGTLIIAIPSKDGIVIAADSRMVVRDIPFDFAVKLHPVAKKELVIAFAGNPWIYHLDPMLDKSKLADAIKISTPNFDSFTVVEGLLNEMNTEVFTEKTFSDLCDQYLKAFEGYASKDRDVRIAYNGKHICTMIIVKSDAQAKRLIIAASSVGLDQKGTFHRISTSFESLGLEDRPIIRPYGTADYLNEKVLNGTGAIFLSEEYKRRAIQFNAIKIKEVPASEAAFLAYSLIDATEKTLAIDPIKEQVGGEILVLQVNDLGVKQLKFGVDFK